MSTSFLVFKITSLHACIFFLVAYSESIFAANLPGVISLGSLAPSRKKNISLPEVLTDYFSIPPMMQWPLCIKKGTKTND